MYTFMIESGSNFCKSLFAVVKFTMKRSLTGFFNRYVMIRLFIGIAVVALFSSWGFFGHKRINRYAVFILPPAMIGFYKKNIEYITSASVNPDRRRFTVVDEAARHYIDLDHYGDSARMKMPRFWNDAVKIYTEDTLKAYGVVPWHVYRVYSQLKDAFMIRDPDRILRLSADLGHYIADAHVPLHTTENYNGQKTGQEGIHAFWESRLVELFSDDYNFFVGKATYLEQPQLAIWKVVTTAHLAMDSVLAEEKLLALRFGEKKYSFETKGRQTVKVYSREYSTAYHKVLRGMVERQMRSAVKTVANFWYTAWIDAGQPDLKEIIDYKPTEAELSARRKELEQWKRSRITGREHETELCKPR